MMEEISWRQWGDAAFEESRRSGKPVLLAIGAVWCHWCHVMDHTTYAEQKVIGLINEGFVPVRVDNDRSPDINARYNMGGWPSTVFLTHNRDVITGATYIPPDQMVSTLEQISTAYATQRETLIGRAREAQSQHEAEIVSSRASNAGLSDVEMVLNSVRSAFDEEFGGFGFGQKFPFAGAIRLLLTDYEHTGNDRDLEIVVKSLDGMLGGELFDRVEGGMFRYATQRDWSVPHYEKLLSDNAEIAAVLLDAYRLAGRDDLLATAGKIFSYAEAVLIDPDAGVFYGSQDADEDYYTRDASERKRMMSPRVDTAVYTDSNAMFAISYLKYWAVGDNLAARTSAREIVRFLSEQPRAADGTVCHYFESGEAREFGNLSDQVYLTLANVMCYEATGADFYLDSALGLVEPMHEFRSGTGAFYDISETRAKERSLSRVSTPLDQNAALAVCLIKLTDLTGDSSYRGAAAEIVDALAGQYRELGLMAADYAIAVAALCRQPVVVPLTGRGTM